MKQLIFLALMTFGFSFKALTAQPFWAVALYWMWAVLAPPALWNWALSPYPDMRWSLIAAAVSVGALVLRWGSLDKPKVHPNYVILVLAFGLCILGSYALAQNREVAGDSSWDYTKIIIMMLVSAMLVTEPRHIRVLSMIIFLSLIYIIYTINYEYVIEGRLNIMLSGFAGLDNNGTGLRVALVLPFCYYLFLAEHRWWRWGYLLCLLPVAHAVMLTYSRGAMLSSILAGAGMVLFTKRHRFKTMGVAMAFGLLILAMAGPEIQNRFKTLEHTDEDESAQSRYASWKAGIKLASDYPIFGVGPRNSNLFLQHYGADMKGRTVHNLLIQMTADCGYLCVLIYLAMYFSAMVWAWKGAAALKNYTTREQRWQHNLSLACFWSLGLFFVGSIFLSLETFEPPYLLILMAATSPRLAYDLNQSPLEGEPIDETINSETVPEAEVVSATEAVS